MGPGWNDMGWPYPCSEGEGPGGVACPQAYGSRRGPTPNPSPEGEGLSLLQRNAVMVFASGRHRTTPTPRSA